MENEVAQKIIVNTCNTCRTPIYEGEPVYSSEVGQKSGTNTGLYGGYGGKVPIIPGAGGGGYGGYHSDKQSSEIGVQCAWCYDQGQAEVEKNKWFGSKGLMGGVILDFIVALCVFKKGPVKGYTLSEPKPSWGRKGLINFHYFKLALNVPITFVVVFLLVIVLGRIFRPQVDRYKLRKRENE